MTRLPEILTDLAGIAFAGCIVFGVYQMHEPTAWIVGGGMGIVALLRLSRSQAL